MCDLCDDYDRDDEPWDCGNPDCDTCFPDSQPEKEKPVTGPFDGMQYRTDPLGNWKDVEPGQIAFTTGLGQEIEFRKKPSLVGKVTYASNKATFFDVDWLVNAVRTNIQNGTPFTLEVSYK